MISRQPCSTLFPYTTLFRSGEVESTGVRGRRVVELIERGDGDVERHTGRGVRRCGDAEVRGRGGAGGDRAGGAGDCVIDGIREIGKSTRLNSSHVEISYAVF